MRPSVRASGPKKKFHQTSVDDAVQATYELMRFWRSNGQAQGHVWEKFGTPYLRHSMSIVTIVFE